MNVNYLLVLLLITGVLIQRPTAQENLPEESSPEIVSDTEVVTDTCLTETGPTENDNIKDGTQPGDSIFSDETKEKNIAVREKDTDIVVVKETLDTVFIFDKSVFKHVARDWRKNIDIFRQRGYGFSGGMHMGMNAVWIRPVRKLVEDYPKFNTNKFHFNRFGIEPLLMSGGTGYLGLGGGFRLGGGGISGETQFECTTSDTVSLSMKIGYGGFIVEKAFLHERWNLSLGGLLGAGSINVSLNESDFFDFNALVDDDALDNERAVFFVLEPHIGLTYTILYFFHLGANIALPTFMSLEKFNSYTADFINVNPGFHLKFIFGNLG